MVDENYKKRTADLIRIAQKKGLIKKYADFCNTKESKEYALTKEEIIYYTSKNKGAK